MNADSVYRNSLFWMPRFYQQPFLSQQFIDEINKFRKVKVWRDKDTLALTQLILIEATRDTTFDVSFGFKAQPSRESQFHGFIDCLLYQRYGGEEHGIDDLKEHTEAGGVDDKGIGFPLIPIFFPTVQKSRASLDHDLYPMT